MMKIVVFLIQYILSEEITQCNCNVYSKECEDYCPFTKSSYINLIKRKTDSLIQFKDKIYEACVLRDWYCSIRSFNIVNPQDKDLYQYLNRNNGVFSRCKKSVSNLDNCHIKIDNQNILSPTKKKPIIEDTQFNRPADNNLDRSSNRPENSNLYTSFIPNNSNQSRTLNKPPESTRQLDLPDKGLDLAKSKINVKNHFVIDSQSSINADIINPITIYVEDEPEIKKETPITHTTKIDPQLEIAVVTKTSTVHSTITRLSNENDFLKHEIKLEERINDKQNKNFNELLEEIKKIKNVQTTTNTVFKKEFITSTKNFFIFDDTPPSTSVFTTTVYKYLNNLESQNVNHNKGIGDGVNLYMPVDTYNNNSFLEDNLISDNNILLDINDENLPGSTIYITKTESLTKTITRKRSTASTSTMIYTTTRIIIRTNTEFKTINNNDTKYTTIEKDLPTNKLSTVTEERSFVDTSKRLLDSIKSTATINKEEERSKSSIESTVTSIENKPATSSIESTVTSIDNKTTSSTSSIENKPATSPIENKPATSSIESTVTSIDNKTTSSTSSIENKPATSSIESTVTSIDNKTTSSTSSIENKPATSSIESTVTSIDNKTTITSLNLEDPPKSTTSVINGYINASMTASSTGDLSNSKLSFSSSVSTSSLHNSTFPSSSSDLLNTVSTLTLKKSDKNRKCDKSDKNCDLIIDIKIKKKKSSTKKRSSSYTASPVISETITEHFSVSSLKPSEDLISSTVSLKKDDNISTTTNIISDTSNIEGESEIFPQTTSLERFNLKVTSFYNLANI
jgi:tetrahydromethanopterin S-methyltransferase subunit F